MAQDEKTIIRSLLDPKIKIDRLEAEDAFTGTSEQLPDNKKGTSTGHQVQNELGVMYPFITINNYVFDANEIDYFTIDATGFLPQVTFIFTLYKTDAFRSQGYPKDGDILSVFLRAKNNAFKPIRNDYIIKNVSSGEGMQENRGGTTTITGELFIPHIKDQLIKSYTGTSFDVLNQIAQELQMGFATNETSTSDSQAWLCAGSSWEEYIQHIAGASWKDENSFYKCYIDVYYHLNFINVNNQLEGEGQLAAGILDITLATDFYSDKIGEVERSQSKAPKFLTMLENMAGTNVFIHGYKTKNESSRIHEEHGYKYNVQFFDMKSLKYWNIFVDPKTSDGAENKKIILKGRTFPKKEDEAKDGKSPSAEEYWKTQNRYVWKGIQSTNVHDKYTFAIAHNERNLLELKKLYLEVNVERWNPNIYNGERIPLLLTSQADERKAYIDAAGGDRKAVDQDQGAGAVPVLDQFYSGYYMVNGVSFTYKKDGPVNTQGPNAGKYNGPAFYQTFVMTRREWPTPLG
jgi:hypothetical protein